MDKKTAYALRKGDLIKDTLTGDICTVVSAARPKYVMLSWPDHTLSVPHIEFMENFEVIVSTTSEAVPFVDVPVKPLKLSGNFITIPIVDGEAEVEGEG